MPRAQKDGWSEGPLLPRWAMWLALPGFIAPLLILGFIVVTQRAHDPLRCPYRELARRDLAAGVVVIEEMRSCIASVEEHRYLLRRDQRTRILGERRFDEMAFAGANYSWQAKLDDRGEVHVEVHNAGHRDVLFREGTAEEQKRERQRP